MVTCISKAFSCLSLLHSIMFFACRLHVNCIYFVSLCQLNILAYPSCTLLRHQYVTVVLIVGFPMKGIGDAIPKANINIENIFSFIDLQKYTKIYQRSYSSFSSTTLIQKQMKVLNPYNIFRWFLLTYFDVIKFSVKFETKRSCVMNIST